MRMLHFIGVMTGAAGLAVMPASAQTVMKSAPSMSVRGPMTGNPGMGHPGMGMRMNNMHQSWGHRVNGRWWGGYQAPGGWAAYRRPIGGFVLPGFWLQPSYYISNYSVYGLPAPGAGYGWSRYYDDAVLTDRYGRVYESRTGYDWDRYGGYDDDRYDDRGYRDDDRRSDDGRVVGGAVIGGVAGGLLGSVIAGPGNRTGGAIIGAGLGAIAGGVIADSTSGRGDDRYYGGARRWADDASRLKAEARERKAWAKERVRLDRLARKAGYANYDAYLRTREGHQMAAGPMAGPHWAMRGGSEGGAVPHGTVTHGSAPRIETQTLPGYVANGYYYPGTTVTTVTLAPSTVSTTRTTYTTTTSHVVAKSKAKIIKRRVVRSCRCN